MKIVELNPEQFRPDMPTCVWQTGCRAIAKSSATSVYDEVSASYELHAIDHATSLGGVDDVLATNATDEL